MRCESPDRLSQAGTDAGTKRASIVIPVRNCERTLARCLEAVTASEGFADFEVIVVDDGSTDTSAEIASRFPVRLIRCATGSGPAAALNRGASEARSPRLVFVDSDVFVRPDTIDRLLRTLDDAPAAFGSYDPEPFHDNFATVFYHTLSCRSIADTSTQTSVFYTYCAAIWRHIFLDLGGFDTRFTLATFEDMELGCRLAERGLRCIHREEILVTHAVQYRPIGLARAYFRKSRDLAALLLSRRSMSLSDQGWTHRKNWLVLASAWGTLGFLPLAAWVGPPGDIAWVVSAVTFFTSSFGIARSMGRRRLASGPLAVAGYLAVNVIATAGMVAAVVSCTSRPSLSAEVRRPAENVRCSGP